jgi:hypothetical protein
VRRPRIWGRLLGPELVMVEDVQAGDREQVRVADRVPRQADRRGVCGHPSSDLDAS